MSTNHSQGHSYCMHSYGFAYFQIYNANLLCLPFPGLLCLTSGNKNDLLKERKHTSVYFKPVSAQTRKA